MRNLALIGVAAAILAACGGGGNGSGSSSPTSSPIARPTSTAQLTVLSPGNGEVVRGSKVDLRVELEGARLVPQTTTNIQPDEGHLHVLLDDELISMTEGTEQEIPDVTAGMHRLTVEFVASDHAPFDPRVVAVVAFEVRP
jgi:ABC-type glycerol-3-phosphate transport system substrate-binding protein